uniref:Cytochrome c oxidase subunit 7A2 n=1 Tax=Dicentrarchus labrax TaxID=13489 RepID=A0A8C4I517_DICLA
FLCFPLCCCSQEIQKVALRSFSSSVRRQLDNKVPQKQKLFQENDGIPIHLKGGTADALLYRTTMALTILETSQEEFYCEN